MEKLQQTINESCNATAKKIIRLDQEFLQIAKDIEQNKASIATYIANNPDVKLEDVLPVMKETRWLYTKQQLLQRTILFEMGVFQAYYMLSLTTDNPPKFDQRFLDAISKDQMLSYVTDGNTVTPISEEEESIVKANIGNSESWQKEFDAIVDHIRNKE